METQSITCLLISTFIFLNTRWCSCNGNSANNSILRCKPHERAALLNFMQNITYFDKDVSSSWEGEECCNWRRVVCDNTTGHILKLHLNGDEYNNLLRMETLESMVYLLELTQLESLDLSNNYFNYSSIPIFMGSMKQLRYLNLSFACLGGLVPYELGNLTNLEFLDLNSNMLSGEIPASLGNLINLKTLDLYYNQLSGKIPTSIGKLSKLQSLVISYNPLEGTVLSEPHLANLSSLTYLDIYDTMLTLNLSSDWVPPFQLLEFYADNCKINGQFPPWLQTQKNLYDLILSNANISGLMPRWFHTMQQLDSVDLSNNNLSGSPIFPINFSIIILSNNYLSGELFLLNSSKTEVYRNATFIDLSNNFIYGSLLEGLDHRVPNLKMLFLSSNQISGPIPNSLCKLKSLIGLDIHNNSLSGVIPNCWANISTLYFLRLSHNKLKGHIPCFNNKDSNELETLGNTFYLHLNDNKLSGEIPSCLTDLKNLTVLDIGGNQLSGKMLSWFSAEKLREVKILRLRDNNFSGTISRQICSLPKLQLMDFGHNQFTGSIPGCLSNLTAMTIPITSQYFDKHFDTTGVSEVIQGIEREYTSNLKYLVDIDVSYNNLSGSIPDRMTKLSALISLNLSYNQLSGTIPENIGGLKSLFALDLSNNKLGGSIPTSMGELYSLSHLNLSYNNLSGQIPTGNQLQTLSDQASIYAGNPYLYGDFLPKKCKSKEDEQDKGRSNKDKGDNKEKFEKMGFGLVVMSGFATGFWGVVGGLVVNRRWRHAVFRRVEDGYNWLYVRVAKARRIKRK
ncbi:receptor-like protein EIX2 [Silene latifolia]|uniref:receptor-like protein EIX2 n=1 Tax=Silene latifolia TaxID=37657 RepID=UPI003D7700AD